MELKNFSPKSYILDENLDITFSLDSLRISDTELGLVFNTKDILAQARISLLKTRIKEFIELKLQDMRDSYNSFEGEDSNTL